MKKVKLFTLAVHMFVVMAAIVVWSCSDDDNAGTGGGNGRLKVSLTDAPFSIDLIEEANVTINKIELRHKDSTEGSPFVVVFEESAEINLVELRNGITQDLTDVELPSGDYDLVRIQVGDASVKLTNGTTYDLKVPSGATSGLKVFVKPSIIIREGLTSELLLDFELNKSFVVKGNPQDLDNISGFNFKPVIRAVNRTQAGAIEGYTLDSTDTAIPAAHVWIETDEDSVVSSTVSDSTGFYALIGLPEGEYSLWCAKEGYDTLTIESVNVEASAKNEIDLQLTKISQE